MWEALENVAPLVAPGGALVLAIYNDQGGGSRRWRFFKKTYNALPSFLRPPYTVLVAGPRELYYLAVATASGHPGRYFKNIAEYERTSLRGMSYRHDLIDWIGGYPFEVAKPEEVFDFYARRRFTLKRLRTCGGGPGCNEFVFEKSS